MTISLARVDDRVIHGQTTTRWSKERPVQGILVVGDEIIKDDLRKKVLKAAARNLKLGIYSDEQGPQKIEQGMKSEKDFFLICSSPQTFAKLVKEGANFGTELNVGCMNTREGALVVGRTLAIDEHDYEAFEYLEDKGINLSFQLLPDDEKKSWSEIKKKYDSLKK
ncbi:PTS system mannose/fructose/N-acetylgalactosamine-transporter subunit IIB [Enterococcus gallinarum]|uniref:PTS system mannose/fructose/N-acetylgalactosamine-transporter subunit IIB n=1 Tax=Enterococcus gallinarum TaxID=1353 RepID=UPI0009BF7460|nr:PTS sugar transporter subunit IIB [Enterococcus gallinarum]OQO77324.1 PTS mannose transporter subunit IIB [Enterococcus gallinarum]PCD91356.1 PTS mannose/fructose/sorbose transporter subunit IIB [Enterococcus gallinarum]